MSRKTMKLVYKSTNKFKNIQKKSLKRGRKKTRYYKRKIHSKKNKHRRTKKYRQKGKGKEDKNRNKSTRKINLGSAAFPSYKPRTPPDYTKYGAFPGTKAYRDQILKRREENKK